MDNELICYGCGTVIQTDDPEKIGYAPPSSLNKEEVICQRCFRLKHYNEVQDISLTDQDFLNILNQIGESQGLIVKVIDIFDFNGSWLPGLHRFVGKNPILLIGNKVDLLPKSIKHSKLIQWMKKQARELGLKPIDVLLTSAAKGYHMDEILGKINEYRSGKDVYIVGCTNVGKSTLINRIIKETAGEDDLITTSHFPGTTLDMIKILLDDGKSLIDTPGIINHHQMAHFVNNKDLKVILPKKEIKPKVFQLNEHQTLFFGGLARFDYLSGGRRSIVCYVSNELNIHRTKLENANALYLEHVGEMLQPPRKTDMDKFPNLVRHEFMIKNAETDIVFSGLGWITINQPGAKVAAYVPQGVSVMLRPSLI